MKEFSAIAFLLLSGCAVSAPEDEAVSRVSVSFVEPEKFTDSCRAELQPTSSGVLGELEKFLIAAGTRYVPESMKLNIRLTVVDLAGDFELVAVRKRIKCALPRLYRRASCWSSRSSMAPRRWSDRANAT